MRCKINAHNSVVVILTKLVCQIVLYPLWQLIILFNTHTFLINSKTLKLKTTFCHSSLITDFISYLINEITLSIQNKRLYKQDFGN